MTIAQARICFFVFFLYNHRMSVEDSVGKHPSGEAEGTPPTFGAIDKKWTIIHHNAGVGLAEIGVLPVDYVPLSTARFALDLGATSPQVHDVFVALGLVRPGGKP